MTVWASKGPGLRVWGAIMLGLVLGGPIFDQVAIAAEGLPKPEGRVILRVFGKIENTNATIDRKPAATFDRTMLENLTQASIRTHTPWTDGVVTYEGPLLRDLLVRIGAHGEILSAIAINDYVIDVPADDAESYRVIVALKMNGRYLTVRTKGPLWIIYPWDEHDELQTETFYSRSIWQLKEIEVK